MFIKSLFLWIPLFCPILLKCWSTFLRLWSAKSSFPGIAAPSLTVQGSQIPVTNLSFIYNILKYSLLSLQLFTLILSGSEELFYSGL